MGTVRTFVVAAALLVNVIGCRRDPRLDLDVPPVAASAMGLIQGTVIDRANNRGVLGATVNLMPDRSKVSSAQAASGMTTSEGAFIIERVVPGEYIVEIRARGYRQLSSKIRFSPGQIRGGVVYQLSTAAACPGVVPVRTGTKCP